MNRAKKAIELHDKGYNCAQAVACAFAKDIDVDEKELFKITEAFGFGMGNMGTCGAVSGMTLLAGLKNSDGNLDAPATKRDSYRSSKNMQKEFIEENGSVICKELKGVDSGKPLTPCDVCIKSAVEIAEKNLFR